MNVIPHFGRRLQLSTFASSPAPIKGSLQTTKCRQKFSRRVVWFGFIAFLVATAGLSAIVEAIKPDWRDPEYGKRLEAVKKWKAEAPDRPIVLLIGTSRVQMGMSPQAMGFPDQPHSPLIYNCGYRGATPIWCCLQAMRWLDSGVKPNAILFSFSNWEMVTAASAEDLYSNWATRLSSGDLDRLAPYCTKRNILTRRWVEERLQPWASQRDALMYEQFPNWLTTAKHQNFLRATSWKVMDRYGFSAWPIPVPDEARNSMLSNNQKVVTPLMAGIPVYQINDRVTRDLVRRCQRDGVAIAGVCSPESPTYRSWYSAKGRNVFEEYAQTLSKETGIPIFPSPDDYLVEEDFADGYHLIGTGAARYSRWLADNYLKAWLASLPSRQK